MTTTEKTPPITQLEFEEKDFPVAEEIARRLGFTQTAYTSTSALWGLFCLPDRAGQREGCIIKTAQFGMMFVADLEDMKMEDLSQPAKPYQPRTGARCGCRRGVERDNCPNCEGTGFVIDFAAIRARANR